MYTDDQLPICSTCPAFSGEGQCRANPPTHNGWPSVSHTDFCCEHPMSKLTMTRILLHDITRGFNHLGCVWQDFPASVN